MKTHAEHAAQSLIRHRACTDADLNLFGVCSVCLWRTPTKGLAYAPRPASPLERTGYSMRGGSKARFKSDFEVSRKSR